MARHHAVAFTCVRNPSARILSSFFDKIASFCRFLLFARDTIRFRRPMEPDIHWSAMSGHIGTFIANGGRCDRIFSAKTFDTGMADVLGAATTPVPRFNESGGHGPGHTHRTSDYFDALSRHLMREIYEDDFVDPDNRKAVPGSTSTKSTPCSGVDAR